MNTVEENLGDKLGHLFGVSRSVTLGDFEKQDIRARLVALTINASSLNEGIGEKSGFQILNFLRYASVPAVLVVAVFLLSRGSVVQDGSTPSFDRLDMQSSKMAPAPEAQSQYGAVQNFYANEARIATSTEGTADTANTNRVEP